VQVEVSQFENILELVTS